MKLRNLLFIGVGIIAGFAAPALADLTYTQGSGTTIFDFVCFTTKHCSAHVPVNSAGTEIATTSNPMQIGAPASAYADGALVTIGAKADAKNAATDTTSVSAMSVWKQISASIQAAVTSLASIDTKASAPLPAQTGNAVNIGAVMNAGNKANTVAASATNFVLSSTQAGGTGATGDYLSHCVIQPGTTSPGSFTILDNATTIYTFPGGASSTSNLTPISVPIGAISGSGGWKITTTTNVTGTCFGKFT